MTSAAVVPIAYLTELANAPARQRPLMLHYTTGQLPCAPVAHCVTGRQEFLQNVHQR